MNVPRVAVEVRIVGRVQGVGYRWSCAEAAGRHQVDGWVRNHTDGSVQAWFEGTPDAVAAIVEWAGEGPRAATVTTVESHTRQPEGFSSFQIRR